MPNKKDHPFKNNNMPLPMKVYFTGLMLTFKVLSTVSPKLAGKLALRIFMTPPKVAAPSRESKILSKAKLSHRTINEHKIAVRVWDNANTADDAKTVLLSHGWAGRTSQFLEFIEPLIEEGYRVVGADIPAHGDSSGKYTNIIESSQVLSIIAKEFGPISAIIGHSFGTGTILLGMDQFDMKSPKVILIGAYSRISFVIELFSELFNLNQSTIDEMKSESFAQFGSKYGIKWDWESIAPINTIKSFPGEILFIHDETDHEVPLKEADELHTSKPDADILITSGFGHRRILRNEQVVSKVIDFIQK